MKIVYSSNNDLGEWLGKLNKIEQSTLANDSDTLQMPARNNNNKPICHCLSAGYYKFAPFYSFLVAIDLVVIIRQ